MIEIDHAAAPPAVSASAVVRVADSGTICPGIEIWAVEPTLASTLALSVITAVELVPSLTKNAEIACACGSRCSCRPR
jgi:hypothetical protein